MKYEAYPIKWTSDTWSFAGLYLPCGNSQRLRWSTAVWCRWRNLKPVHVIRKILWKTESVMIGKIVTFLRVKMQIWVIYGILLVNECCGTLGTAVNEACFALFPMGAHVTGMTPVLNKTMPGFPHGSKQVKLVFAQFVGWLGMMRSEMCKLLFYKETEFRLDGNYWGSILFQGKNQTKFAWLPHPLCYIRQWDVSYTDISSLPDSKVPLIVLLSQWSKLAMRVWMVWYPYLCSIVCHSLVTRVTSLHVVVRVTTLICITTLLWILCIFARLPLAAITESASSKTYLVSYWP